MTYIIHLPNLRDRFAAKPGWRRSAILIGVSAFVVVSANLVGTASATTSTIGTTAVGGSTDTGDGGSITCNRYGATGSGAVSSMSVSVGTVDPSSKGYSLAIYGDASSNPSSLLGSATGTLTANSWNTLSVSAPVTSGGYYWLCYNSSTSNSAYNNVRYTSGSTPAIYKAQAYGTWPSTFGTVGSRWTDSYSIYATVGSSTPTSTTTSPSSTTTSTTTSPSSTTTSTTTSPSSTTTSTTTSPSSTTTSTTPPSSTITIGTTAVGSSTDTGDGGSITCNRYGATGSGAVSSMSVSVGTVDPSSKGYSLAIYGDASSNPSSLLGSATGTLTANSWNTLSVSAPVTSGGYYWLCYNSSTSNSAYNNVRYTSGSTPAIYKAQAYGTWPSTFGTVGSRWTDSYSIYATVGSSTPTSTTTSPSSTTTSTTTSPSSTTTSTTTSPSSTTTSTTTSPSSTTTSTTPPSSTITIGTTAVGSSTDTGDGGSITCNRYGATGSGAVSSMSVSVGTVDPSSKGYSLAIYGDASSNPSSLLGSAT